MNRIVMSAAMAILFAGSTHVSARSFFWSDPVGGELNDPANWGNDGPPGADDNGFVRAFSSPIIEVDQNTNVRQLVIGFGGDGFNEPTLVIDDNVTLDTVFFFLATGGNGLPEDGVGTGGRVIQSAGVVNNAVGSFGMGTTANVGGAVYELRGGELNLSGARGWVGQGDTTGTSFIQTGGVANFNADENAIARFVGSNAIYSLQGGSFAASNLDNGGWGSAGGVAGNGNGVFEVVGSDIDSVAINGRYRQLPAAAYRAKLDNGGVPEVPVGSGSRWEGSYDVDLLGGAVLLDSSEVVLFRRPDEGNNLEFASLDAATDVLWNETSAIEGSDFLVKVELDPAMNASPTPVNASGDLMETTFASPSSTGFVEVDGNSLGIQLLLDLDTDASPSEILDFFSGNPDLSVSGSELPGYDVSLTMASSDDLSGYFAWDLAGLGSGSSLNGVASRAIPEPSTIALLGLLSLVACHSRRRPAGA